MFSLYLHTHTKATCVATCILTHNICMCKLPTPACPAHGVCGRMCAHVICLRVHLLHVLARVSHCPYAHVPASCVCVHTPWCVLQVWCCVCLCVHTHVHVQATCFWDGVEPQAEGRGQEEQSGPPASSPSLSHSQGNAGPFAGCVHDPERPAHPLVF